MIRRLRAISTLLMLLLGTAGVAFGVYAKAHNLPVDSLTLNVTSIAGSALFGASLTMFIDNILGTELMDIKSYLFKAEKFETAPEFVDQLKGRWHHYDLSEMDGKIYWQYLEVVLEKDPISNTLRGVFTNHGHDGTPQKYDVTTGYRNGSMVTFMRARDSSEKDSIEIIPGVLNAHLRAHLGMQFLETWDGNSAFTYTILSRKKLVENTTLSADDQKTLFAELKKLIEIQKINPIVSDAKLTM